MAREWPIEFRDNEELKLTRNGTWLSDGEEITHLETVKLFHRSLKRNGERFQILVGRESKAVIIEDTPYFVLGLDGAADAGYWLRLSDETREKLDPETLRYGPSARHGTGRLTARVKGGSEEARFLNPAYFQLLSALDEDDESYFVMIEGKRVNLMDRLRTFEEFWPFYVEQHSKVINQNLHVTGFLGALSFLGWVAWTGSWALAPLALVLGYGFSWVGHFFFERNQPATFQYPVWSFRGDLRMVGRKLLRKPLVDI